MSEHLSRATTTAMHGGGGDGCVSALSAALTSVVVCVHRFIFDRLVIWCLRSSNWKVISSQLDVYRFCIWFRIVSSYSNYTEPRNSQ